MASADDMKNIAESFFTGKPQLVHMVSSPEGLWVIMTSYEYQQLARKILSLESPDVSDRLLNSVDNAFAPYENRSTDRVDVIHRHKYAKLFMMVNASITISSVLSDDVAREFAQFPIFKISFYKWSIFDDPTNKVSITVEYLPTENLEAHLPPYNPYKDTETDSSCDQSQF